MVTLMTPETCMAPDQNPNGKVGTVTLQCFFAFHMQYSCIGICWNTTQVGLDKVLEVEQYTVFI